MPGNIDLDDLLAGINLDGPAPAKANTTAKKNGNGEKKAKPLFDTLYEGFTVQPISPPVGEKKTWSKCAKKALPFDAPKLVEMAKAYQQKTNRGAASHYRALGPNQQGIIDRVLEERLLEETDIDAVWELHNVRPIEKDVPRGLLRMDRIVSSLEVIICRKDRRRGAAVDKPKGTTTQPQRVQGEIIDLNVPLVVKVKSTEKKKKAKAPLLTEDELMDIFPQPQPKVQQPQQQQQQQIPPNPDPRRYFWNGNFYEDIEQPMPPLPYPEQPQWDPRWQQEHRLPPQNPHAYPPAPMPHDHNPFQPHGVHPDVHRDMPVNMDPRAPYEPQRLHEEPHHDRRERHSRSRSRSRSQRRRQSRPKYHSRRQYHDRHTPSMSSSEADMWSDWTPPSTPPGEEWMASAGAFHNRKGQRYYRENRTPYRDERVEIRPGITGRIEFVEDLSRVTSRPRPILIHDDYPQPKARITNFAETFEEADFGRRRPRDRGMDMLREPRRRGDRRYEGRF